MIVFIWHPANSETIVTSSRLVVAKVQGGERTALTGVQGDCLE